jgi:diadenosine tetraphosphate (Ap4A) HIT family hydrolase
MNETIEKFGYPETLVHEYEHWVVLLRPQQITLGSLILACKEPVLEFGAVSPAGYAELRQATADIEQALTDTFAYQKINYLMLMMVDPHVHFHVIPRYAEAPSLNGRAFPDQSWPGPPALNLYTETDADTNQAIIRAISGSWPRA